MRYEGAVYRPPSEAGSLILQTTIGCSHNQCIFCVSFMDKKFREREMNDIIADIAEASTQIRGVTRVFLADGNAMVMDTSKLLEILSELYEAFPMLERVGVYATPQDMLEKSAEDLAKLKEAGLSIVYLGVESGNEEILKWIKKGATRAEVIEAGKKCKEAEITLSVTVINGLGGREKMAEHAYDTATLLNEIDPDYIGLLTMMVCQGTPLARQVDKGLFQVPDPLEILHEIEMMIKPLELTNCVFRCNHASNYLPLKGTLPRDKEKLLKTLSTVHKSGDKSNLRPEYLRGL
ncbi:MAG: radical SAM protein [Bacillota bacterium]|nr:radical SAM protein [Bacillota bacterium]